uniref:Putative helicase n=1 Tax=viral metagenome TaxID=1070528 RepID=A0A6H1Z705_9ZZZZ
MNLTNDVPLERIRLREIAMNHLTQGGATIEETCEIIKKMYLADKEDFTDEHIERQVLVWHEVNLEDQNKDGKTIRVRVEDWLTSNTSNIGVDNGVTYSLHDCYLDLGLKTPNDKTACRMAFKRLVISGKLEPLRNRSGLYRYINGKMEDMDFINIDSTPFSIKYPLGVHRLVNTYRKTLVVIAGEPNAGKTAYLLNTALLNMNTHNVTYFSSEMGPEELQVRLKRFERPLEDWKKVRFVAKTGGFKDVIDPNGLSIIDYLECAKDFYEVGGMLTEIFNSLKDGVAIVAIQKPSGRNVGIGGERTLDKARLYMAIEPGIIRIVKGKIWKDETTNPNGMWAKWNLVGGAKFTMMPDPNTGDDWRPKP